MRRAAPTTALLALLAVPVFADPVAAVWEREDAYWRYVKAGDVEGYVALWHDDFVGWPCGQPHPMRKASIGDWVRKVRDERLKVAAELTREGAQDFGDTVVVHYSFTRVDTWPDGRVEGAGRVDKITHTWKKVGDTWLIIGGMCGNVSAAPAATPQGLAGAWRSTVQFEAGAFAGIKDLQFMYTFHTGGTLTESSNYDAAPPVPPAYGAWREVKPGEYEAKYEFFVSKAPKQFADVASAGGWMPGGRGVLVERIVLGDDGRTFRSTLTLDVFDETGSLVEGGSAAAGRGVRNGF
jgi:ketosteroid isomerase-like protein